MTLRYEINGNRSDLSDSPAAIVCTFGGEAAVFSYASPAARVVDGVASTAPAVTIVRAPASSEAQPVDGEFAPDLSGLYQLKVRNGEQPPQGVTHVRFPAEALTDPRIAEIGRQVLPTGTIPGTPRTETVVREMLRRYVAEQLRTNRDLTALDAITAGAPLPASIDWSRFVPDGG